MHPDSTTYDDYGDEDGSHSNFHISRIDRDEYRDAYGRWLSYGTLIKRVDHCIEPDTIVDKLSSEDDLKPIWDPYDDKMCEHVLMTSAHMLIA